MDFMESHSVPSRVVSMYKASVLRMGFRSDGTLQDRRSVGRFLGGEWVQGKVNFGTAGDGLYNVNSLSREDGHPITFTISLLRFMP